jgi:hypothetical protein
MAKLANKAGPFNNSLRKIESWHQVTWGMLLVTPF